jgi:hypothetical protein
VVTGTQPKNYKLKKIVGEATHNKKGLGVSQVKSLDFTVDALRPLLFELLFV